MAATAMMADRRKRNLTILGGVTLVFVLLAMLAVYQRAAQLAPKFEPRALFPGLSAQVNGVTEVDVTSKTGTLHIRQMQGKWNVAERDSFPADAMQVAVAERGLSDLEIIEPKTARADWLNYLGLGAPPMGDASEVKLIGAGGKVLADLLIGRAQGTPDELGRSLLYVRRPDQNQAWLARGYLTPKAAVADWLDKNVIAIARDRLKGAVVNPPMGPSYTLARDSKEAMDFKMVDLPRGRELSFEGSPDGVASAIIGFSFDDVAKADQFNFNNTPQSVFNTFDGLNVMVKIASKGIERWASVSAQAGNPMVQSEADAINARNKDWAYKLPEMKVNQILATRETMLRPADEPGAGKAPPGLPAGLRAAPPPVRP
jgi:hypothetical protein